MLRRTGDHRDPAAPCAMQMSDAFAGTTAVVDVDEADLMARMAADEDEREAILLQTGDDRVLDDAGGDDHAVDVAAADDALVDTMGGESFVVGVSISIVRL